MIQPSWLAWKWMLIRYNQSHIALCIYVDQILMHLYCFLSLTMSMEYYKYWIYLFQATWLNIDIYTFVLRNQAEDQLVNLNWIVALNPLWRGRGRGPKDPKLSKSLNALNWMIKRGWNVFDFQDSFKVSKRRSKDVSKMF